MCSEVSAKRLKLLTLNTKRHEDFPSPTPRTYGALCATSRLIQNPLFDSFGIALIIAAERGADIPYMTPQPAMRGIGIQPRVPKQ